MSSIGIDLQHAARRLLRAPAFALPTVAMLALGIALSVAMFSLLRGVVLEALPYPGGDGVVSVWAENPTQAVARGQLTPAEAERLAQASDVFQAMGYYNWGGLAFHDGERPRETTLIRASAGFFPALGVQPMMGRWFEAQDFAEETGALVLSHGEWLKVLGGAPDAVGRLVDTSQGRLRVIGVMPPEFTYPSTSVGAWRPLPDANFQREQPYYRNARFVYGVGRLREAGTGNGEHATDERLEVLASELRQSFGLPDEGWRLGTSALLDDVVGDYRGALWGVFGIALLVLLIACANVAILLDARQVARRHEQAVSLAMGASRSRVYRGLLLELGLIALVAVAAGTVLAVLGLDVLRELARASVPRADNISLVPSVLLFAAVVGLITPFLAALAGSLRLRGDAIDAMRGTRGALGERGGRMRLLPAAGIALSTVGAVVAAAMAFSLGGLQRVDPGFDAQQVHALQFFRNGGPAGAPQFADELLDRLRAIPGVQSAAMSTAAPLSTIGSFSVDLKLPERDAPEPVEIGLRRVTPDFLDLLRIPLLAGRGIEASDRAGSEAVAVVNRSLARQLFGEADPIGRQIEMSLGGEGRTPHRIVGVMADVRNAGLRAPAEPELLIPFAQHPWVGMTFLVRTQAEVANLPEQMAEAMWALSPDESITRQFALSEELESQLATAQFFARTVGAFALLALLLGAFGVYAVSALQQQRRRAEFGLRLALGAGPRALGLQILRDGLAISAFGLAVGLSVAWFALRLVESQLFGLERLQFGVVAVAAVAIALAAVLATLMPALRASRTDPMESLRHE